MRVLKWAMGGGTLVGLPARDGPMAAAYRPLGAIQALLGQLWFWPILLGEEERRVELIRAPHGLSP